MMRFVLGVLLLASFTPAADPPRWGIPPEEKVPDKVFQTVPADIGPDWGVTLLNAPAVWKTTKGKGVKVAVLDTGASLTHPDLKEAYKESKDFTRSRTGAADVQGHGTHCAGSVGARGPLPGVAPECWLYSAKVLDDSGSGGVDDIAAGIRHAVKVWEVDVISMSLGGPTSDDWIPPALEEAVKAGVIVVSAAGNDGPRENSEGYPGRYKESISVAACDKNRFIADFSSRGPNVFIVGPGVDIRSTWPGGQYSTISGTSMATPHIAGLAALWIAAHPEVKKADRPAAFREALKGSTKFTDRTTARGYGFPDGVKAVGAKLPAPVPPPAPGEKVYTLNVSDLQKQGYTRVEFVLAGGVVQSVPASAPPVAPVPHWTGGNAVPVWAPPPPVYQQMPPPVCEGGNCQPQQGIIRGLFGRFR